MILRGGSAWQTIIADLALILFLISLGAVNNSLPKSLSERASVGLAFDQAEATAIYRPDANVPSLAEWLTHQPADPRQQLTIIGRFNENSEKEITTAALDLAATGRPINHRLRVVLEPASTNDIMAVLTFDAPTNAWHTSCSNIENAADSASGATFDGNITC